MFQYSMSQVCLRGLKGGKEGAQFSIDARNYMSIYQAQTYLLLPLGKWDSKWDDFYWPMGCV